MCRIPLLSRASRHLMPFKKRFALLLWFTLWFCLSAAGATVLSRLEIERLSEAFQTDARIAHRLLSQRAVEHDAVLTMLSLLQPGAADPDALRRLPALYPQILRVEQRGRGASWPAELAAANLSASEAISRERGHAVTAEPLPGDGRFWLVLAAEPLSHALLLDLRAMVPQQEWPAALAGSTRVELELGPQAFALNEHTPQPGLRQFAFRKKLATASQPFDVVLTRSVGWAELPWRDNLLWSLLCAALLGGIHALLRQRQARQRAEELLRLGQTSRLNALGEMAAGLAHELNQPLTAVMANTQAAGRLLDEEPPELETARQAMHHAIAQARRAADVLSRLRATIERPESRQTEQRIELLSAVRRAMHLLEPEFRSRGVQLQLHGDEQLTVSADPIALEQILHNLINNALQAMEKVPAGQRQLDLGVTQAGQFGMLDVGDSGPGIAPDALPHLFEPFFSTRSGGLGLGLSLSETLANSMGGRLSARNNAQQGATFSLALPLSPPKPEQP